jgi:hypothetical protein
VDLGEGLAALVNLPKSLVDILGSFPHTVCMSTESSTPTKQFAKIQAACVVEVYGTGYLSDRVVGHMGRMDLTLRTIAEHEFHHEGCTPGVYWIGIGVDGPTVPVRLSRDTFEAPTTTMNSIRAQYDKAIRNGEIEA